MTVLCKYVHIHQEHKLKDNAVMRMNMCKVAMNSSGMGIQSAEQ